MVSSSRADLAARRPAGFPNCPRCAYLRHGLPTTCLECVESTVDRRDEERMCPICDQHFVGGCCPNELCADDNRRIIRIRSIVHGSPEMRKTILRYRHEGRSDWSLIFGRLVIAWLDQYARTDPPDVIVANPTFIDSESGLGHTEKVMAAAAQEDAIGEWSIDSGKPRLLVKNDKAPRSSSAGTTAKRLAETKLYHSLAITDPLAFEGRRVLLYDNESVTGRTLNTVAAFLLDKGGALRVEGLVLVGRLPRSTNACGLP